MASEFYVCSELPEPFRAADLLMEQLHPQPKFVREPKVVPMPRITENRGAEGPIGVTEDWYIAEKQKQMKKREKAQRVAEVEMIQHITRKEMLRAQLGELDIRKPKDAKKMAAINVELKNIDIDIKQLETQYGIEAEEIDKGTRVGRFLGRLKKKVRKIGKAIKRFYKRNFDLIYGLASIFVPILGAGLIKKIFHI